MSVADEFADRLNGHQTTDVDGWKLGQSVRVVSGADCVSLLIYDGGRLSEGVVLNLTNAELLSRIIARQAKRPADPA